LAINETKSAFNDYTTSINLDSSYSLGYVGRGDVYIYQQEKDKEAALIEYKRAIQADPNSAIAHERMGNLYYNNFDNLEAAIEKYEKAAELFLKNGQINSYNKTFKLLKELNKYIVYTAKPGDSLSGIAQEYGISTQVIISANRETYPTLATNPDRIEIGWKLKIPQ